MLAFRRLRSSGSLKRIYGSIRCLHHHHTANADKDTASIEPKGPVRVRFAPSPTGFLHLGGLRTALFNYLLARRYGGEFILRIEDTDQKRFVAGATENIIKMLDWAGVSIDEGPGKDSASSSMYFQSQRGDIYRKFAQELLDCGAAYRCFCSSERLENLRETAVSQGRTPLYDRHCTHLSKAQIDEKLRQGQPHTIRLLAPNPLDSSSQGIANFDDIVHGRVHFKGPAGFDDAVLLKSDGLPTYHLANVVDDHLMGITHVLRGEEWLISTPKHITLFKALGWQPPKYAHLPLLMNKDGSKLSKRNRDGPMQNYIDDGYLPSALVNYVALLGWHPQDTTKEIFTLQELEQVFTLGGLSRSRSIVTRDRLDWLNKIHLRRSIEDPKLLPDIAAIARKDPTLSGSYSQSQIERALNLAGDRLTRPQDLYSVVPFLFTDPDLCTPEAIQFSKNIDKDNWSVILRTAESRVSDLASSTTSDLADPASWKSFAKDVSVAANVPKKQSMMMLRLILTGQKSGPAVPDLLAYLGTESIKRRISNALDFFSASD